MKNAIMVSLAALFLLLQYQLWFAGGGLFSAWRLNHAIQVQQTKNSALNDQNQHLSAKVNDLKSDSQSVEAEARSDLGMIKKGETFYQVVK